MGLRAVLVMVLVVRLGAERINKREEEEREEMQEG